MAAQLRGFFNIACAPGHSESIHPILSDIARNAQAVMRAERASLFLVGDGDRYGR
jgi:hypothetical protein